MGKKLSPTLVGGFVVGALALVVIGIITFGSGRLFSKTFEFVLYFDSSVNGLNIGAPVKVRGVEIGTVNNILLNLEREKRLKEAAKLGARQAMQRWSPRIPVIIEIDAKKLTSKGSTGLALSDPEAFDALIEQGLRGQLQTESLVTGLLYIDLDFHPGSSVNLVEASGSGYKEIPTIPTTFEAVQAEVMKVIGNLKEIKIKELIDSATETIEGLKRVIDSPEVRAVLRSLNKTLTDADKLVQNIDSQITPVSDNINEAVQGFGDVMKDAKKLVRNIDGQVSTVSESFKGTMTGVQKLVRNVDGQVAPLSSSIDDTAKTVSAAMVQAKKTLSTADGAIGEDSPLMHDLTVALTELSAAARSIRVLANYLERNPDALLYGKR
ncbi:MAG: MlaD family protein [Deltaproteobacteria bacterium]|nr:MlaD family protein [Deltaproteobacteria bacterium]